MENIELLFFAHDKTRITYLEHFNKKDVKDFSQDGKNGLIYECLFRAPHPVIGFTNNLKPIFHIKP